MASRGRTPSKNRRERTRHSLTAPPASALGPGQSPGSDVEIAQPLVRPALEILDPIDHPSADLAVGRAGAEGAVLLERTAGEAEEARGLGGAQVAGRKTGVHVGHDRASGKAPGRIDAEWRPVQGRIPGVAEIDQEESRNISMALVSRRGAAASEAGDTCRLTWPRPSCRSLRIRLRELLSSQSGGASSKSARAISRALLPARSRSSAQIRKAASKVLAEGFGSLTGCCRRAARILGEAPEGERGGETFGMPGVEARQGH